MRKRYYCSPNVSAESIKPNVLSFTLENLLYETYFLCDLYIHGDTALKKGGAKIIHHHDHRIVMSFYIANLICEKPNKIDD